VNGDVIASYKQVTYSDASITISLSFRLWIPQVRGQPHGFFFSIHSARFSASSTLSCKSSMLQQSLFSLFKHVLLKRSQNRRREVAVFVRESASIVTDKMDTDHEATSAWTDLARWQKKGPGDWTDCTVTDWIRTRPGNRSSRWSSDSWVELR